MENKFHDKRRNYYIKKEFQRNFILKFCALVALGALISGAIIYAMSVSTVTTTFENSRLAIKSTSDYILPAVLLSSLIMMILVGFATIVITLFTSHKIAGPLYRIERDLEELAAGNLNIRFNLRGGDEIKALAANLDQAALSLKLKVSAIKNAFALVETSSVDVSPDMKDKIQKLGEVISKLNV
jgi:methyl-accepting chemotaxis protein